MPNIIRALLVPPVAAMLVLTSWCIVYASDSIAARVGADAGWLWPVVCAGAWLCIRMIPDHEPAPVEEPYEVMRAFTPKELYGDDHDDRTSGGGGFIHMG